MAEAQRLDAADPLRARRAHFRLPEGITYLDGNSLGALPDGAPAHISGVVEREWGEGLVRSWNDAGWIDMPRRVGTKIAPLIGAEAGEVIACDSVSVNLFKLIWAALCMRPERKTVLSEPGNFPTDIYMLNGLAGRGLAVPRLAAADMLEQALDSDVALLLLPHVHYQTGAMHDLARLTRAAHDAGALVLWDLSHSAGAVPVDLASCEADFAVGCGYKYLNGGPGAPGFAYVAQRHLKALEQPLTGWMGHSDPFSFRDDYEAAPGIEKLLAGTPSILALAALEHGAELIADIGVAALVAKSRALSEFTRQAAARIIPELPCISPADPAARGSQLSWRHDSAFALSQALIARGVIGDFRTPDVLRFGFAPAYNSFADCWHALEQLRAVLDSGEWQREEFNRRGRVT
nr:kynureninase [Alteraurantiacibacter aestuarii]